MKYLQITTKFMYYFTVIGTILMIVAFAIMNTFLFTSEIEGSLPVPYLLIASVEIIILAPIIYTFNKSIHLRVNLKDKVLEYGSVFFYQEAPFEQVKKIKKVWFGYNSYWIEIGESRYIIQAFPKHLDQFKKELGWSN